jgi:hypothetical protein
MSIDGVNKENTQPASSGNIQPEQQPPSSLGKRSREGSNISDGSVGATHDVSDLSSVKRRKVTVKENPEAAPMAKAIVTTNKALGLQKTPKGSGVRRESVFVTAGLASLAVAAPEGPSLDSTHGNLDSIKALPPPKDTGQISEQISNHKPFNDDTKEAEKKSKDTPLGNVTATKNKSSGRTSSKRGDFALITYTIRTNRESSPLKETPEENDDRPISEQATSFKVDGRSIGTHNTINPSAVIPEFDNTPLPEFDLDAALAKIDLKKTFAESGGILSLNNILSSSNAAETDSSTKDVAKQERELKLTHYVIIGRDSPILAQGTAHKIQEASPRAKGGKETTIGDVNKQATKQQRETAQRENTKAAQKAHFEEKKEKENTQQNRTLPGQ